MAWQVYGKPTLLCETVPLFPGPHPGVRRSRRRECLPLHTFFISPLTNPLSSGIIPFVVASVAHLVERHLAKVEVASSSLVTRSILWRYAYLGTSPFFLVPGTRYLHLNLKSEVGGPAKAIGFCGYGSGFEPRHSLQKRRSDPGSDLLFWYP